VAPDAERSAHARTLAARLRGEVRFGRHDRMLYATDASIYQVEPLGVIVPADADDAVDAVRACAELGLPILPRGGGTSLAGQCVNRAVVLDLSAHCREIGPADAGADRVRAGAGVTLQELNDRLRPAGVFFAPDPSTVRQANVGGCIGNNAAGTRSVRYGRTAENLLAVEACLADGTRLRFGEGAAADDDADPALLRLTDGVIDVVDRFAGLIRERFPRTLRRNAGYALDMILDQVEAARAAGRDPRETVNLAHLLCGSEGTLAVTLGAELRLHPIPRATGLAVIGFDDLDAAIDAVQSLLELRPTAVELLDDLIVELAGLNIEYRRYVELMPQPSGGGPLRAVLYVEFWEDDAETVRARFEDVRRVMAERTPTATVAAYDDPAPMAQALKLRSAGEPLLHALPGNRTPLGFVEDNAVPVERLGEFVRRFRGIVEREDTRASFYAHASVGVLHVRPLLDLRDEGDRGRMERIAVDVADLAKELGGVMSGEHGDGRVRGPLLERYFGPELLEAFREVKRLFDPEGRLNPGNIVDPQPLPTIHEHVRVRPEGENITVPPTRTWFAYAGEGGFDHAVELCNGAGVCRKRAGGTMCPSYRATQDERHSTRGRGNALRLAITGQLSRDAAANGGPTWDDPDTLETLDLCLSCKACASECPSNVDVATYKAEYLAQSYAARGGPPLAARVFGRVRGLNRLGSAFAPLSNVIAELPPIRAVTNRVLGLSPKRSLPAFAPSLFRRMRAARPRPNEGLGETAPAVVLYADCFSTYNEPEVGLAAIRLLNGFGYRVVVPPIGCCGRPPVSTGLLDEAARCRDSASAVLAETMQREDAAAVVVLEPSCLSAIQDEWRDLQDRPGGAVPHPERLERIAAASALVEDFLARGWDEHPRRPAFAPPTGRVLLHGHCHQKALGHLDGGAALLRRIAGDRLTVLDTGCCGMAGSFGYVARRYELSMAVGEESLFPVARAMEPDDVLCAPGTSCRHQVHDGTGRTAVHPVVWAASRLRSSDAPS
jgi:FAD/FMN-containing dehydrogenase/Fe-S oxidoreductase